LLIVLGQLRQDVRLTRGGVIGDDFPLPVSDLEPEAISPGFSESNCQPLTVLGPAITTSPKHPASPATSQILVVPISSRE
jgi:hypothetical protein